MEKVVLFVILDKYTDWEGAYLAPFIVALGQGEYTVKTVSLTKEGVQSIGGFTVLPDYTIESAPADFEGVVLVGGMSWRKEEARQVMPLVRAALDKGKVLGGICDAAGFLGTMGVLNDVHHTGNDLNDLKQWAGDAYSGEEKYIMQHAVRDNNIVTANGTAPLEFAREVILALGAIPESKIDEWYKFYKLGCYETPMPSM